MADYEDYRNTSTLSSDSNGYKLSRTLYLRGESELDVIVDSDCPIRGQYIDIPYGSATLARLYCDTVTIRAVDGAKANANGFLWEVSASYSTPSRSNPQVNKARWEINFRPQQFTFRHVDNPADQIRYGPAIPVPPQYPTITTGINVTEDGPQGVDVDEMVEVLTIEFWKDPDDVDAFLDDVRPILDCTNDAAFTGPWGTYAIGEARITGLSVATTVGEMSAVSVEISRSKNVTKLKVYLDTLADEAVKYVEIDKLGWEYSWVRFIKGVKDATDADLRSRSIDVYVAKVYEAGDYDALGIDPGIWQ